MFLRSFGIMVRKINNSILDNCILKESKNIKNKNKTCVKTGNKISVFSKKEG